jgi:hypothetical protein
MKVEDQCRRREQNALLEFHYKTRDPRLSPYSYGEHGT